jgi:hypothetical protein
MSKFADYLREVDPLDYFSPSEMNYIIVFVYTMLNAAAREECDKIAFTTNDVTWSKGGLPKGQESESPLQSVTFRETIKQIIDHDPVVREHLKMVKQNQVRGIGAPPMDSYQILYPELAAIGASASDDAARRQPIDRS